MKQSFSRKNPHLLQEEDENLAEETNDDADVNVEANNLDDNNKDMVVTMKEEKKTLEHQETMNVDIGNIASKKQLFWRPIYEVTENSYLKKQNYFQQFFKPM